MRHLVVKDQARRRHFSRWESYRRLLEGLARMGKRPQSVYPLRSILLALPRNGCCRPHNRCLVTRRSRFVLRMFGLERRNLRDKFTDGFLPAIQRVLW